MAKSAKYTPRGMGIEPKVKPPLEKMGASGGVEGNGLNKNLYATSNGPKV